MKRHDTHLLSDESEKGEKEEDAHQYIFNNSKNSSKDSEEKYISKDEIKKFTLFKNLVSKNHKEINISNENNNGNASIISSTELENVFCNDYNNASKKEKLRKHKLYIKLRKIKLYKNNKTRILPNYLTYNPSIRNKIIGEIIGQYNYRNRNCITLTNSYKNIKRTELKKKKNLKENEILNYFYNENIKGSSHLKFFINILNNQKLKISKTNFSIKTKKKMNLKINNNFPYLLQNQNLYNNNEREVKLRENNYYNSKLNFLSPIKFHKRNNLFINNNKRLILNSNNSSKGSYLDAKQYFGKSRKNSKCYRSKKSKNKIKNKIEILYNIYIGNNNFNKFEKKSNKSIFDVQEKKRTWIKKNKSKKFYINIYNDKNNREIMKELLKIQARDIFNNFYHYEKHRGNNENCPICQAVEIKNEENILKKGINPKSNSIGNDSSQNSWQNRRVYSALSRILTKNGNKKRNEFNELYSENINANISKCLSISKNKSKENFYKQEDLKKKLFNKDYKIFYPKNKKDAFRKLNINKSISFQNNYSTSIRFYRSKSQSIMSS